MEHPLKTYRTTNGLSRRDLAMLLGVGMPAVFRWESGARKIDQSLLAKITEKTGIPAEQLRPDLAELFGAVQ